MPALGEYTNVYDTAVKLLRKKGYNVWIIEEPYSFACEKDGWDFVSESPCGLLGLVSIFDDVRPEKYVENWWKKEGENQYRTLSKKAPKYTPIFEK